MDNLCHHWGVITRPPGWTNRPLNWMSQPLGWMTQPLDSITQPLDLGLSTPQQPHSSSSPFAKVLNLLLDHNTLSAVLKWPFVCSAFK